MRIIELSEGELSNVNSGDGWPGVAELQRAESAPKLALHVGSVGLSHRGRDESERRFQNPGRNRPIANEAGSEPMLLGLWEEGTRPVLVGFDPTFRARRSTRQSLFIPLQLLEDAAERGWAEHTSSSGERLVAFWPGRVREYYRYRTELQHQPGGRLMSAVAELGEPHMSEGPQEAHWLTMLAGLVGAEDDRDLAQRILAVLAVVPDTTDVPSLVKALAAQLGLAWDERRSPGPAEISLVAAALDRRVSLMVSIWPYLGKTEAFPLSHQAFLERVHEDARFVGAPPPEELDQLVLSVMASCDESVVESDLDEFLDEGLPTPFFYESIQSHLEDAEAAPLLSERAEGRVSDDSEEAEESAEEDHDEADAVEPVRSQVKSFTVKNLFELVDANRLDLQPPWQRRDVWSRKKKRELIRSLLLGIPLPSIILHRRGQQISIIDGKQRLTAIVQFMRNDFKLPNFAVPPGHQLFESRGAWFNKAKARSLSPGVRTDFELRDVPALLFEDVPERRLRQIFHLYNVSGTRLNAAEIRNAVYQSNAIHRMAYVLAGEARPVQDLETGDFDRQQAFTTRLRAMLPSTARYAAIDFLCRYLAYSRAAQKDEIRPFKPPSTSSAIDLYFDYVSDGEDSVQVAKEIMDAFDAADRFFDIDDERLPYHRRGESGDRKFNRLIATSHLVAGRFLHDLIEAGRIAPEDAVKAARDVVVAYPDNQQRSTIWDHQARLLLGLRQALGLTDSELPSRGWIKFFQKMEFARLPDSDE